MAARDKSYAPRPTPDVKVQPFESAEEAWFWFILANRARNEGARIVSGLGPEIRPCQPVDILRILDRLHRNRRLMLDHLLVLRHYGNRQIPPDPRRVREARACGLWREALQRIGEVLESKGIVVPPQRAGSFGSCSPFSRDPRYGLEAVQ